MAVWMAYAALAAYQAYGGIKRAEQIRSSANLTRQLNEINARYAEVDAFNADLQGYAEAAAYQPKIDAVVAEQKAGYRAQNVDTSFGTAKEMVEETQRIGFLNQIEMENQAKAKARGFRREAARLRTSGGLGVAEADHAANSAMISGYSSAFESGLKSYESSPYGEARRARRTEG